MTTPNHMMTTREKLAIALTGINAPADMVERARRGYYDDYLSELAAPIATLVSDLRELGTAAALVLSQRAMEGEFDGTLAEAEAWASTPEAEELKRKLGMKDDCISQPPPAPGFKGGDR